MLANYAEAPNGPLTVVGGGWDTINVTGPPPDVPAGEPAPVVVMQGAVAIRLMLRPDEAGTRHGFVLRLMNDETEVARIEGDLGADRPAELPVSWDQGVNMAFPLSGLGLPNFGLYRFVLEIGGRELGTIGMQVIKRY
jgi:hypothetical protein